MSALPAAPAAPGHAAVQAQRWFDLETRTYESHAYECRDGGAAETLTLGSPGPVGLCLTSVHAVNHWAATAGTPKVADRGTGSLVEVLATSAHLRGRVITRKAKSHARMMATVARLARATAGVPTLVVDIHGMKDSRDLDGEFGFGFTPGEAEIAAAEVLGSMMQARGLHVAFNEKHPANYVTNIVNRVRAAGGQSFQLEIAARARPPVGDPARAQALLDALQEFAGWCLTRADAGISNPNSGGS